MTIIDRSAFIKHHPTGETEGVDPRCLPKETLRELGQPESPIEAIRVKCIDCCGGSIGEARKCTALDCPLWAFRMGVNPHHAKATVRHPTKRARLVPENPDSKPKKPASKGIPEAED